MRPRRGSDILPVRGGLFRGKSLFFHGRNAFLPRKSDLWKSDRSQANFPWQFRCMRWDRGATGKIVSHPTGPAGFFRRVRWGFSRLSVPFPLFSPDFAGFETGSLANTGKCIFGGHYTAPLFNSVKRGAVVWLSRLVLFSPCLGAPKGISKGEQEICSRIVQFPPVPSSSIVPSPSVPALRIPFRFLYFLTDRISVFPSPRTRPRER